ncbi:MAG: tetratricopeptide repeat protein, partial [Candidatus Aminicenantales bacterium]
SVKEQRRFGAGEIVEFSREKITDRPEATPFEVRTVAEMCMNYPATLKDSRHDRDTIIAVEEAERLYRRLGDQAGIERSVDEKIRIRARLDQAGSQDLSSLLADLSAPPVSRIDTLSKEIHDMLARGEFERAMEPVAEYTELARESGDKRAMIMSLDFQSKIVAASGDAARAAEIAAEQKALLEETGDAELEAKAMLNNGLAMLQTGQFDQAREILQNVARTSRERDYASVEGAALWGLGGIACQLGLDLPAALDFFRDSVAAFQRVMDGPGMVKSMAFQAQVLAQMGRAAEALPLIARAHKLALNLQMNQEIEALIGPVRAYVESEAVRAGIMPAQPAVPSSPGPGGQAAAGSPSLEQVRNEWAFAQFDYMKAIAEWKSLPFLKRRKTPKPQPPTL